MQTIQKLIAQLAESGGNDYIYAQIVEAIRKQDVLWAAFSPVTKNYYTGMEHGEYAAYLFSEKPFSEQFQEELQQKNIRVNMLENKASNRMLLFGDLLRTGVTVLVIDSGQKYVAVSLFEILEVLEGHNPEHAERIVMNPHLLAPAHFLYQRISSRTAATGDELAMLREISKANYISPLQVSNGVSALPMLRNPDGSAFLMLFTDWVELRRFEQDPQCGYQTLKFQDARKLLTNLNGIVINPYGVNIVLDKEMLRVVDALANGTLQMPEETISLSDAASVRITPVSEDAQELMDAASALLKEKKNVNAAYLCMMTKPDALHPSYLMILDVSDPSAELYKAIAEKVMPLANGLNVEFMSYQENAGKMAAENAKPFFKKRRFLFFG